MTTTTYAPGDVSGVGEICTQLSVLIGQLERLSDLARQFIAPHTPIAPLAASTDAAVYGTPIDTPQCPANSRLRACIVVVNGSALAQVFIRHGMLPNGQVELFHGFLIAGQPANVVAAGTHVPKGATFRLVTTVQSGGTATSQSIAAYCDPLPQTPAEFGREQMP
jgi:hypothetical protein